MLPGLHLGRMVQDPWLRKPLRLSLIHIYYYVDKTGLIKELIEQRGKTNLFTRPRRFGKSLNMSMLKCFFETDCDKSLFDGLEVSSDSALCDEYMGKFPVISVSLKGTGGENFEAARGMIYEIIKSEVRRHQISFRERKTFLLR